MQTFLPVPDFAETARLLDSRRLGKQRVEALQVLRALTREAYGWKSHPAVLMWAGFEEALVRYALAVCDEWRTRGGRDTVAGTITAELREATGVEVVRSQDELAAAGALPAWLGDEAFHAAHRSSLVRKDEAFYRPLFPDVPDDLAYLWPVRAQGRRQVSAAGPDAAAGRR